MRTDNPQVTALRSSWANIGDKSRVKRVVGSPEITKEQLAFLIEISGGQQQRVAIARALAHRPRVLIADEPTGQLDSETAQSIMQLIRAVVRDQGVTAVVATHDPLVIRHADRVIELSDGEPASGDHSC
jgi:putative ABC transport system ATP-binding protein